MLSLDVDWRFLQIAMMGLVKTGWWGYNDFAATVEVIALLQLTLVALVDVDI
jgi:hypothetical protein